MKHIVGFSGGVDSQACARWVLNRFANTLGFNRVGCAPCINSSKADILNWNARRPEMIDKVRGLEARTGRTFFMPVDRDGVINKVDEVVRWAGTARGGERRLLPMMLEREGCESKYGLCE